MNPIRPSHYPYPLSTLDRFSQKISSAITTLVSSIANVVFYILRFLFYPFIPKTRTPTTPILSPSVLPQRPAPSPQPPLLPSLKPKQPKPHLPLNLIDDDEMFVPNQSPPQIVLDPLVEEQQALLLKAESIFNLRHKYLTDVEIQEVRTFFAHKKGEISQNRTVTFPDLCHVTDEYVLPLILKSCALSKEKTIGEQGPFLCTNQLKVMEWNNVLLGLDQASLSKLHAIWYFFDEPPPMHSLHRSIHIRIQTDVPINSDTVCYVAVNPYSIAHVKQVLSNHDLFLSEIPVISFNAATTLRYCFAQARELWHVPAETWAPHDSLLPPWPDFIALPPDTEPPPQPIAIPKAPSITGPLLPEVQNKLQLVTRAQKFFNSVTVLSSNSFTLPPLQGENIAKVRAAVGAFFTGKIQELLQNQNVLLPFFYHVTPDSNFLEIIKTRPQQLKRHEAVRGLGVFFSTDSERANYGGYSGRAFAVTKEALFKLKGLWFPAEKRRSYGNLNPSVWVRIENDIPLTNKVVAAIGAYPKDISATTSQLKTHHLHDIPVMSHVTLDWIRYCLATAQHPSKIRFPAKWGLDRSCFHPVPDFVEIDDDTP